MIRPLLVEIALFLTPFILYGLILLVTRRSVMWSQWSLRGVAVCAAAAMVLMVLGLLLFEWEAGAPPGSRYVPAQVRDGVFQPGHFE